MNANPDSDELADCFRTPQELAGSHFQGMISSKQATLTFLHADNIQARLAALLLCDSVWMCGAEPAVVEACAELVVATTVQSVRVCAVSILGRLLEGTRSPAASRILAQVTMSAEPKSALQSSSYWALRSIQFGGNDPEFCKRLISDVKLCLRYRAIGRSEEDVKSKMLGEGEPSASLWASADEVDWDFVRAHLALQ